jgi:hypothetical protein
MKKFDVQVSREVRRLITTDMEIELTVEAETEEEARRQVQEAIDAEVDLADAFPSFYAEWEDCEEPGPDVLEETDTVPPHIVLVQDADEYRFAHENPTQEEP